MKIICGKFLLRLTIALLLSYTTSYAQLNINGSIGFDLTAIGTSSESNSNAYDKITASRYLTNHLLGLAKRGYILNDNFATYSISSSFKGYFSSTNTSTIKNSFYKSPDLNTLMSELTFFPTRTYPVNLFYTKTRDVFLYFDKNDRAKTNILNTGLAVIEKNRQNNEAYGSTFNTNLFTGANLSTQYKSTKREDKYDYDYNENRRSLIDVLELPDNILSNTVRVILSNDIIDDSVHIISSTFDVIIGPDQSITLELDPGTYFIDFIPLTKYIQSSLNISLEIGNLYRISIEISEFPTRKNVLDKNKYADVVFEYLNDKLNLKSTYKFENGLEELIDKEDKLRELRSNINYSLSQRFDVSVQSQNTSFEEIKSETEITSTNEFRLKPIISFTQERGINGIIDYDIYINEVDNPDSTFNNTKTNLLTSSFSLNSGRLNHRIFVKGTYGKQERESDIVINTTEKGIDVTNDVEFEFNNIKLAPSNQIRIKKREVVDTTENNKNDVDILTSIEVSKNDFAFLGNVNTKLGYLFVKREDGQEYENTKTINLSASINKEFSHNFVASFTTTHSWKNFEGINLSEDSLGENLIPIDKEPEYNNNFSFRVRTSPWKDLSVLSGYSFGKTPRSSQASFLLNIQAYVSFIKLPFSTEISHISRKQLDNPKQTTFSEKTSINYIYNKINIELSHEYVKEKLLLDTFAYYELGLKITRLFTL